MSTQELVIAENHLPAPMTVQEMLGQVGRIQEIMKAVMKEGEHFGKIPGCGDKPSLLQPGAQKLVMTFRLVPVPTVTVTDLPREHREYRVTVQMLNQRGDMLGAGVGSCSTMESKYRFRTGIGECTDQPVPKAYWDLRNSDPAKAKALLGGMIPHKNEEGRWVLAKLGERVEHDNPADYYNTCEKMAFKRALVSATLTVTAASDIFTQDLEDLPPPPKGPTEQPQKDGLSTPHLPVSEVDPQHGQDASAAPLDDAARGSKYDDLLDLSESPREVVDTLNDIGKDPLLSIFERRRLQDKGQAKLKQLKAKK